VSEAGSPVAAHKTEGPSTCLTFLGIQIDSVAMQLSLPPDKLSRIRGLVLSWRSKRAATKQELQSLIGHLSHAATVVQHGRTFMRRMFDLAKRVQQAHHHVRLSQDFRSDLQGSGQPVAWDSSGLCVQANSPSSQLKVDQATCLSVQDVAVDSHSNPSMVRVHLQQSKTDPFRHGVDIFLGRTDAALCPVAAILAYCAIRPAIVRPFFAFRDGSPLTRDRLVAAVRSALSHAGVDTAHYSGHSFRVGAATTAARAGLSQATIKMLGRWESSAYERYIRTPRESLAAISRQLIVKGIVSCYLECICVWLCVQVHAGRYTCVFGLDV
jgi:hypothetical protein